jgi:hypothetical protein
MVAFIASLKLDGDSEFVLIWRSGIGQGWIGELFEDVSRTSTPAEGFDCDVSWGFVMGLKEVVGVNASGEVFQDKL